MDFGQGKVVPVNLEHEMKNSYIDYAMSVIVARALPDVRDGLKPVHRRILYAMQEAGMGPTKPYKKSARIVGEVLGKYHPHGDSSVYDAIVRMAQDFSMRYMLADGHGNFGSVDGDPAAAMRYTEVRMSRISELMLQDIDKETVDFVPNYDESLKEPSVLPAKFPQLLVNGTSGIAVGMATNIPPHNMGEVIDGTLMLIDHPDATVEELMTVIKGPDFPTAGLILGTDGIKSAYTTGRGVIKMRANARIETLSNGKPRIIVTELPYQVNKARLVESIAQLVRDKEIEGITALNDESDRTGMRIVIDLRRDANANVILNQLYKHTKLQDSFGVIMLALVDGKPQVLNLKQVLHYYIKHQEDVITRRTQYELKKAQERAHILEGLTIALDHLDAVITTIRESRTADIAKAALMEGFSLSDRQAQAILDLRLQHLTGLEREKIEQEYQETLKAIEEYKAILADENRILGIIKTELTDVKKKFGDARRTKLTIDTSELNVEDLIAEEDVVITLTHGGYVKRIPLDTYRRQNRGGKGVKGMATKEKDFVESMLITTTHHTILFFTNRGRVYQLKAYEIAEASRQAKGTAIINLLQLQAGETITAIIQVKEFNPEAYLFFATKKGIVKKTRLVEYQNLHKGGLNAINLDEDDDLIGVKFTSGSHDIILGTKWGMAIAFSEDDVRPMGRVARGVKGIKLNDGDEVIGMDSLRQNSEVLTVTADGLGKRTEAEEYRVQTRGGKGLINLKVTEKSGDVVGLRVVHPDQELLLITTGGIVLRTNISDIRLISRNTTGVKLMTTAEGDQVASIAVLDQKD
ncbi:DNA gyrase subunit A [Selenomonas sp.]|uniref:DNA gyrase subunit A n=2 Tax=Selenomonas sp. TaxID=2053611 RepID=UPI002A765790|nr:DNA gyrase subunit A [Selenomonas sp.]MDY3297431.1 DNA gyrase subunit A [Selenomonas sp.]